MKTLIISLLALIAAPLCTAQSLSDYRNYIEHWEGYRSHVYKDSRGYETVGIGHKLNKDEIKEYRNGHTFSSKEINELFRKDLGNALLHARTLYINFDSRPYTVKLILVDLEFNLGDAKLRHFIHFNSAINSGDYILAADSLYDSLWYHQVGRRGRDHVEALMNVNSASYWPK